jgi:DUF1680 family protein
MWEAKQRNDPVYGCWMKLINDLAYHQAHKPLYEQEAILGHSVRAMYLLTACADIGGQFLNDAKRLWADATERKMYITGGIGSEPQVCLVLETPILNRMLMIDFDGPV